jgi:hypothetical protein
VTWFRVDDTFATHPKAVAAGNAALGLWVRAGSWSGQQLTEGYIPSSVVLLLGGRRSTAEQLVRAGLWVKVEGGYQFHQWEQANPTRAQVEADREAARQRQKRARDRAQQNRTSRRDTTGIVTDMSRRDSRVTSTVSHGPPDPTRPVLPTEVLPTGRDAASGADARTPQTLIAEWIDHCGQRPPGKVVGQVSKLLEEMLTEGIPYPDVRAGLVAWQFKGLHPSALPSVVHETRTHTTHQSTTDTRIAQAQALKTQLRNHTALGIGTP